MFDLCVLMFAEWMSRFDIMNTMMTKMTMNTTRTTNTTNTINHQFQWLCIKIGH